MDITKTFKGQSVMTPYGRGTITGYENTLISKVTYTNEPISTSDRAVVSLVDRTLWPPHKLVSSNPCFWGYELSIPEFLALPPVSEETVCPECGLCNNFHREGCPEIPE